MTDPANPASPTDPADPATPAQRLLLVHAHPDDESIGNGATMAQYVAEGRGVTLVTCTPLGINSQRILVTGERITPTPQEDKDAAGAPPDIPGFPWWAVVLVGGTVLVGVYVWRSGYPPKAKVKAAGVGAGGVGDADAMGTPGSEG